MKPVNRDRALADALRSASAESYQGSLEDLAKRIDAAATPILAARRRGDPLSVMWWDFAAQWARTLVPVGLTVAAASVTLLWLMRPVVPADAQPVNGRGSSAIMSTVRRGAAAPDLVDRAVEDLVGAPGAATAQRQPR